MVKVFRSCSSMHLYRIGDATSFATQTPNSNKHDNDEQVVQTIDLVITQTRTMADGVYGLDFGLEMKE